MKRGQVQHAFTFIMFILVAGMVILFGYSMISNWLGKTCDAERVMFQDKIISLFDMYDDYGSLHKEALALPCGYEAVCFVDSSFYQSSKNIKAPTGHLLHGQQEYLEVVETGREVKNNIFLIGEFAEPIGFSEKVAVPDDVAYYTQPVCIETRGSKAHLIFKGNGQTTIVEGE